LAGGGTGRELVAVSAVADAKGVAETDLTPLYEAVGPDALERVLRTGTRATVGFEFEGYEVTVHGDGHVELGR
jgi:hypothetical protein